MRKLAIVFLSATLLTSSALASSQIVATYNDGEVTSDQVMEQFKPMLDMQQESKGKKFSELDKNFQDALVRGYINKKLFAKEAGRLDLRNSNEFKTKLKEVESELLQQELIERHIKASMTDKMIDEEYAKLVDSLKGQKEAKTSHILVKTEETAKEIKKKFNKGSKFEALAKEFSIDDQSKVNGGELDYFRKEHLAPEFASKAFSMKKDEVSDPVKTDFGWHIIKLLDSRDIKVPSKSEVTPAIKRKLSQGIMEQYIKKLSEQANVSVKL